MYVYVLLTKLYSNRTLDYCIVRGVYSSFETCEKEMFACFNNMCLDKQKDIVTTAEVPGIGCSVGTTKKLRILWYDGKITEYCMQERILDQLGG